jgi:hypothetical protein
MKELKKFIENKDYDSALTYLKSNKTIESPILNYNLGFIYFKKSDHVQARTYLEKAQYEGLRTPELMSALYRVKAELGIQNLEKSYSFEDNVMMKTIGHHEDVFFALMGSFLLVALLLGVRGKYVLTSLFSILFLVVCGFYAFIQSYEVQINREESFVYKGPSKIFEQIQIISPGMKLITKKNEGNWSFVTYPQVYRGWLFKSKVNKL